MNWSNKEAVAAYMREYRRRDYVRVRKRQCDKDTRALYAPSRLASNKRYKARNPEKRKAHTAVQNAIRCGKLVRLPCLICGDHNSHGHHPDYSKQLDVIWLCNFHHKVEHGFIRF